MGIQIVKIFKEKKKKNWAKVIVHQIGYEFCTEPRIPYGPPRLTGVSPEHTGVGGKMALLFKPKLS